MKPRYLVVLISSLGAITTAHAQSSVLLYGIVSTGLTYTNNQGGHANLQLLPGTIQANRWGVRGREDLGGGYATVFVLENGFSSTDGTLQQGGREFGRQAYVGITSDRFGTITLGRQYDSVPTTLGGFESVAQFAANGTHVGDPDNGFNSFRINNSIKYTSIDYSGLSLNLLYGASNAAGAFANNRTFSAGVAYNAGPLQLGIAYLNNDNPGSGSNTSGSVSGDYAGMFKTSLANPAAGVAQQRVFGAGAAYTIGNAQINLLYTDSFFRYADATSLRIDNYEINANYRITPATLVGAAYIYTDGEYHPQQKQPKWDQFNVGIDTSLSKRTDVSLVGIYQLAAGDATVANIYTLPASSTKRQLEITVGIRHKF
jgi:GBP family porin